MKRIACIFLLFSLCGIDLVSAESVYTFSAKQLSLLHESESSLPQGLHTLHANTVEAEESDHNPFSKKGKKRKKAIQLTLVYFEDEQYFKIIDIKVTSPYFLETFYSFYPYFGDDERGPPVGLTVS